MKKRLLIICSFILMRIIAHAQNPVPNSGFEFWTNGEPDGWMTNNAGPPMVNQVSPGYNGLSAARGEVLNSGGQAPNITTLFNPFPVTLPFVNFNMHYKYKREGNDLFFIVVLMKNANGSTVGRCSSYIGVTDTNWTYLSLPITYTNTNMTNCVVNFLLLDTLINYNTAGAYFEIDDLSFSGVLGLAEYSDKNKLQMYPNPVSDYLTTSFPFNEATQTLYDITGRAMLQQPFNTKATIDVSKLSKGVYIAEIKDKQGKSVKGKVVKE